MTSKIVEVLAQILEGMHKNISLEELNKQLVKKNKFDKTTLSVAFSLVYDRILPIEILLSGKKKKENRIRMLAREEEEVLGAENYNYLLYLYNVGLIDVDDFESILEQAMMFPENTITRDDINWIILISLVDINSEILPGSRILLHSTDTIN